ncbi:MAG: DUF4062 domain-containing protein [Lysobacteraceae bacterium]
MHGKSNTKIFIASSMELSEDRKAFRELIMEQNNAWHEQGAFLQVVGWEHFLDAMSQTRLQDEYNKAIRDCDIFVLLFHSKVGKYSREEFEIAFAQFKATGRPLIYIYCKPADPVKASSDEDRKSLAEFKQRLEDIGHFATRYENLQDLQLKFLQQLYRLAELGHIHFAPPGGARAPGEPPPTLTHVVMTVQAGRDAVIAAGDESIVVGAGGMVVSGNASGNFNTGTQTVIGQQTHIDTGGGANIGGNVTVSGGDFIGRDHKGD